MWAHYWIAITAIMITIIVVFAVKPTFMAFMNTPARLIVVELCATVAGCAFAVLDTTHQPSPRDAYVHAFAGWVVFSVVVVGYFAIVRRWRRS